MKKIFLLFVISTTSIIYANCIEIPSPKTIDTAIESKNLNQAKILLNTLKNKVKNYLSVCDKKEELFEQMNIMLFTIEDKINDLEEDMHQKNKVNDCSVMPSRTKLVKAFDSKNTKEIESIYMQYKKNTDNYIENCVSHEEYAMVYESAMLCDEKYEAWKEGK
jgi:ssDNA-specific exonuclease RecJ